MPSSISPTLAKMPIAVIDDPARHLGEAGGDAARRWRCRRRVAAPRVQSKSAPPISTTGSAPASVISQKRKAALVAPKSMVAPR